MVEDIILWSFFAWVSALFVLCLVVLRQILGVLRSPPKPVRKPRSVKGSTDGSF